MRYRGANLRWAFTAFLVLLASIAVAGIVVGLARSSATELIVGLAWGAVTLPPFVWARSRYVPPAVTFRGDRVEVEAWGGPYSFQVGDLVRVRRYVNRGGLQYRVLIRGQRRPRTVPVAAVAEGVEDELLRRVAAVSGIELDRRTEAKVAALRSEAG